MQESSMNSGGVSGNDSPTPANLFDEFEEAFQNCLAPLTKEDPLNGINQDELKVNAETNAHRFLELAHRMESFFLQKRFLLSVQKPEFLLNEENQDMKAELQRKEELIKKQTEKLSESQNTLMNLISRVGSMPTYATRVGGGGGLPAKSPSSSHHGSPKIPSGPSSNILNSPSGANMSSPQMTSGHGPSNTMTNINSSPTHQGMSPQVKMGSPNVSSSVMNQSNFQPMPSSGNTMHSPMGTPTQSNMGGSPMNMMSPQQQQSPMGPSSMGPSMNMAPSGPNMQQSQGGSGMFHGGPVMGSQGGLQGPLAYLEKTTTNIGMPEVRR